MRLTTLGSRLVARPSECSAGDWPTLLTSVGKGSILMPEAEFLVELSAIATISSLAPSEEDVVLSLPVSSLVVVPGRGIRCF